jgi:hypothetical protein
MIKKKKNINVNRSTAQKILDWCYFTYGRSKINGPYPYLEFRKPDYYTGDDYGYYDEVDQTIFVNREAHLDVAELVKTIIHEYWHYVSHSMHEYRILSKYLSHHRNPLEIDARRIERRDYKKCLRYLKKHYDIE